MRILFKPTQYTQQRQQEKKRWIYPVHLAMEAEYFRQKGHTVFWDNVTDGKPVNKTFSEPSGIPFLELPSPDRLWTGAMDARWQKNGNFKHRPGTYMQVADGCWWGKCTFCKENGKPYVVRNVDECINEVSDCHRMGFNEIFDDSGCFPYGDWLNDFCDGMYKMKYFFKDLHFSCNMRLIDLDWKMLKDAGFRMILFGAESANQGTLDKINKGVNHEKTERILREASRAGLENHIAVMLGYPWETKADTARTLKFARKMLSRGYAKTAQASIYDDPGFGTYYTDHGICRQLYKVAYNPIFWVNTLRDIRCMDDIKYLGRKIQSGLGG